MSHFSLAVFTEDGGKTLQELMLPYWEELEVEPYIAYTREDVLAEFNKAKHDIITCKTDSFFYEVHYGLHPDVEQIDILSMSLEEFVNWLYSGYVIDDKCNVYTTYNPNSKWDWYEVGGRWSGMLFNIYGNKVNSCKVKHLDWQRITEALAEEAREYWLRAMELEPKLREVLYGFMDKSLEEYIAEHSTFATYAVLLPDGKWYSRGEMGWWGITVKEYEKDDIWRKNYKSKFIDTANPEWTMTIVDCHI